LKAIQNTNWSIFLILTLYALAFNQFALITADTDLWGHIKFGEELWKNKSFPTTNLYSYTAPEYPWINHEWLAELIFYAIYSLFDSTGLLIFKGVLGLLIVHLIYTYNHGKNTLSWALAVVMFLAIPTLAPGFMVRPHLWTYLFFTILLILLAKGLEEDKNYLYWIPLLLLVWVNCHGGVIAGLGILSIVTFTETTRSLLSGKTHWKPILVCFVFSCLTVQVNPHGIELWDFFLNSLSKPRNISEWNPISIWSTQYLFLKTLVVIFLITLFLPGKKPLWQIVIITFCIYFGFKHQRHSVLTAIILTCYLPLFLSNGLKPWGSSKSNPFKNPILIITIKLFLSIFMLFQLLDGFSKYGQNKFKILVEPQVYPSYLAQFMKKNNLRGNILIPFDWGEYFIWNLPTSKISIDGRFRTAYPEDVIMWNQQVYASQNPDTKLLKKYPTDLIVIRKKDSPKHYLSENKDWTQIYEDPIAILFVDKLKATVLENYKKNELFQPQNPPSLNFP
jgi:hypothetical protein